MRQKDTTFWLLGLSDKVISDTEKNLPDGCRVKAVNSVSSIKLDKDYPRGASILFFTLKTWKSMGNENSREFIEQNNIQQVLVLDDHDQIQEEDINEMGSFLGILRLPVTGKALENFKAKAVDILELYTDLHLMAKEIALERELLARKNMQLEFLNRIITRSSSSLNLEEILAVSRQELSSLIGSQGLCAIFWKENISGEMDAEIFLPKIKNKTHQASWKDNLLAVCKRFTAKEVMSYKERHLTSRSNTVSWLPNPVKQVLIPLYTGKKIFGALLAVADEPFKLGRDQLQIINSAGNHLSLALRNALKYKEVKQEADFDGLTSIYNRQQFDKRIRVELKRHQRHAKHLSLIMLDLDYFKRLNDTYGHLAGDEVLRKVGSILEETVRETDFPARYGGEEFVVILPETNEQQAWLFAERLRKKISNSVFSYNENKFNVTASIGVASLKPGPLSPGDALVSHADQALYMAKNSGRNIVCTSADLCVGEAILN
ncbi:MAG: sensor domain-containing diguanylate cyclase [Desulfonatronovibrio sp.]